MDFFDESLNKILVEAYRNVLKLQEQSIKKNGNVQLTITEIHLIEAVGDIIITKMPTISDLAVALNITRPSTTVAVSKLEGKKYLLRSPCENDGRSVHVALTKKGMRVYTAHKEYHRQMIANLTAGLSEVDRHLLSNAFNNLNNFFKESLISNTTDEQD